MANPVSQAKSHELAAKQVQVPFAVSQLAQDAALACLEPEAEKELFTRVETVLGIQSWHRDGAHAVSQRELIGVPSHHPCGDLR